MSSNPTNPTTGRLRAGDTVPPRQLSTIAGIDIQVPDLDRLTHLQFRRFAACPLCNVHLRSVARRYEEIEQVGVREIAVFHSPVEIMQPHQGGLPFAVVADPDKVLYDEFGVEFSVRANLHPRAWTAPLRPQTWAVVASGIRAGARLGLQGDTMLGLPADFLIAPDGTVLAARYGAHANDQWSVDDLLELAGAVSARLGSLRSQTAPDSRSDEASALAVRRRAT